LEWKIKAENKDKLIVVVTPISMETKGRVFNDFFHSDYFHPAYVFFKFL
jgi:hypothetical protein